LVDKPTRNKKIKNYAKYSGLAYQIFGLLAVSIFIGIKADDYFGNETRYITAGLCLLSLLSFFYRLIRELS